jgi:hypothetical protein
MAVETEAFTASNGTDITSVGSSIWAYSNGSSGDLFVTSNEIRPRLNFNNATAARRAGTFTNDQYAQIVLRTLVSTSRIGVIVRGNTSGSFYALYAASNEYWLLKLVSYSFTLIRFGSRTFNTGDVLRLEVSGTGLTALQNGTSFWTATDASISAGNPGVSCNGENASLFTSGDSWEGGDLVTAALQNFQYDWPHQLHARR